MAEAKKKVKKYYEINQKNHTVTIDTSVKATKADEEKVKLLVNIGGYEMRFKSEARAAAMKAKANNLKKEDILKAIDGDKEAKAKYEAIMKGEDPDYNKGFMCVLKWYKNDYLPKKNK